GRVFDEPARHGRRLFRAGERVFGEGGEVEAGSCHRRRLARRRRRELGGRAAGRLDDFRRLVRNRRLQVEEVAQRQGVVGPGALVRMSDGGDGRGGEGRRLRHRRQDVEEVVVFVRGGHRDVERRLGGGRFGRRRRGRAPRRGRGRGRKRGRHLHRLGGEHLVEQLLFRRRRGGRRLLRDLRDRGGILPAQGRRSLVDQLLDPRRLRIHLLAQGRLRGL